MAEPMIDFTGYTVGPTSTDYVHAMMYAADTVAREVCESNPDIYTWVSSTTTRYPCPEGLACNAGECKFKKDACLARSQLPYHDCARRAVPCDTSPSGLCEVCDYSIEAGHTIIGPFTNATTPVGCVAGDDVYVDQDPYPTAMEAYRDGHTECETTADCADGATCGIDVNDLVTYGRCTVPCSTAAECERFNSTAICGTVTDEKSLDGRCFIPRATPVPLSTCPPTTYDPPPYSVLQYADAEMTSVKYAPVPCVTDEQCVVRPGVGGVCGREPGRAAYGFCVDPARPPYLEWRDEIHMWDDLPPVKNMCVQTLPYMRQWCEMPWTRAGVNEDDYTLPLSERVRQAWKTKARPPFWYNEGTGQCHVTKKYCTNNLKNGGYSAGYGKSLDFWLGSACTDSTSLDIKDGFDCCTTVGDAISQFFIGRTLTTDFRELVTGDPEGFGERWQAYIERVPQASSVIDFVSDPRLKHNLRRWMPAILGPTVHGYTWSWNARAHDLYALQGDAYGVLSTEVPARNVVIDHHGYEHIVVDARDPRDTPLLNVLELLHATPTYH